MISDRQHSDGQRNWAAHDNGHIPLQFARQPLEAAKTCDKLFDDDASLEPRQRGTQAKMSTVAEGETSFFVTRHVEAFRLDKLRLVVIR